MQIEAQRSVTPLILNLGARSGWVVNDNPQQIYLRERVTLPNTQESVSVRMGLVR